MRDKDPIICWPLHMAGRHSQTLNFQRVSWAASNNPIEARADAAATTNCRKTRALALLAVNLSTDDKPVRDRLIRWLESVAPAMSGLTNAAWWGFLPRSSLFETIFAKRAVSPAGGSRRRRDRYGALWRTSSGWKLFPKRACLRQVVDDIRKGTAQEHERLNGKPNRQNQEEQQDDSSPACDDGCCHQPNSGQNTSPRLGFDFRLKERH